MVEALRDWTAMNITEPQLHATPGAPPATDERRIRRLKTWIVALSIISLLALTAVAFTSYRLYISSRDDGERPLVASTAKRFVTRLTTYSYAEEGYVESVETLSTGKFRKEFEEISGNGSFEKKLDETKATSKGNVVSVNIESIGSGEATVFVVVDKTITNSSTTEPQTERSRIELTMVKTVKGWKIDNVNVL